MEQRYVLHLFFFPTQKWFLDTHDTRSRELSNTTLKSVGQVHEVSFLRGRFVNAVKQTKTPKSLPVVSRLVAV